VYEYDVFVSYQRTGDHIPAWVRNHFYPMLAELLDNNLDREVRIFYDGNVPGGGAWPLQLQSALQRTRILVPVCSPKYFVSEWCLAEWHSMAQREELVGMATLEKPQGLIYPVIFCDSKNFPAYAHERRMRNLHRWSMHWPQFQDSLAYLDFHHEVALLAEELEEVIDQAPEWQPDWPVAKPEPGWLAPPKLPKL
jgi:hypothetical protein